MRKYGLGNITLKCLRTAKEYIIPIRHEFCVEAVTESIDDNLLRLWNSFAGEYNLLDGVLERVRKN